MVHIVLRDLSNVLAPSRIVEGIARYLLIAKVGSRDETP